MPGIESRSFDQPDETKAMDKTTIELVGLAGGQIQRTTFEPGWRWSERIGPVMGADRCQVEHIGYAAAGRLQIEHDDGTVTEIQTGEVFRVAPGARWVGRRRRACRLDRVPRSGPPALRLKRGAVPAR